MPVDIEQWRAGIGNFNGCCQCPVARIELTVYNIFSVIAISACVFLLILLCISNLSTILHLLLVFFVFTFSPSVLELLTTQNILFKDKYFALLYWTRQLYLWKHLIYLYVKYYQLFQCFVLYVLFASPFTSAWRYREILVHRVVKLKIFHAVIGMSIV